MAAGVYTLEVEQGATKNFRITYKDALEAAIDLTGYAGRGAIKLKASDAAPLAELTVTVSDPTNGIVDVSLSAAALKGNAAIKGKTYAEKTLAVYDIEVYTPDDADVIRLLNGPCNISPEVTK